MTDIKIRPLTRKDRKTFGKLMVKLVDKTGRKELRNMVPATQSAEATEETEGQRSDRNAQMLELAFSLLHGMLDFVDEDLTKWFVELVEGVDTVEQFDELDFNIDLIVVEKLLERDEFLDFFSKGSQVFSKIKGLAGRLKS